VSKVTESIAEYETNVEEKKTRYNAEELSPSESTLDVGVVELEVDKINTDSSRNTEKVTEVSPEDSELPPGWVEVEDPSSGKPYYYNAAENRTTWEKPPTAISLPVDNDAVPGSNNNADSIEKPATNIDRDEISSHGGEENEVLVSKVTDSITESETNVETNETEFELSPGWVELLDPSGKPYYYNEAEGVSLWEKPTILQAPKPAITKLKSNAKSNEYTTKPLITDELDTKSSSGDSNQDWVKVGQEVEGNIDANNKNGPETTNSLNEENSNSMDESSPQLPFGWVQLVDNSSGRSYFYNKTENISAWDIPTSIPEPDKHILENEAAKIAPSLRLRPAHAIASFGFGGKLCVMIPQMAKRLSYSSQSESTTTHSSNSLRKGPVLIHRVSSKISETYLPTSPTSTMVPLNSCSDTQVMTQLKQKAGEGKTDNELLWSLIFIAAKWKGRLRSHGGFSDPHGPESAIVDLLLRDAPEDDSSVIDLPQHKGACASDGSSASLKKVQDYLLRGQREEAVSSALSSKNYALALLLASMCSDSTYQTVARRFADEALHIGSPLHTVATLFSQPSDDVSGSTFDFWNGSSENLHKTWRYHLSTILSNQTAGWKKIVVSLGDQLLSIGYTCAAHFCYIVSGSSLASKSDPSARLVLVGCDHSLSQHVALLTPQGLEGYKRTEAFEWSKRKGNPHATVAVFQPFKLRYAMLLADHGFDKDAKMYVDSIRKCTGLDSIDNSQPIKKVKKPSLIYPKEFVNALDIFDDRLCKSLGLPFQEQALTSGFPKIMSEFVGRLGDQKNISSKPDILKALKDEVIVNESDPPVIVTMPPSSSKLDMLDIPNDAPNVKSDPVIVTMPPEPSLPDPIMIDPLPPNPSPVPKTPPFISIKEPKNCSPAIAPAPTPINQEVKQQAPSSGRSWVGIKSVIAKYLNPDASIAVPGLAMEAYFDEKKKKWIFPDDDPNAPDEVALGPPPTTPRVNNAVKDVSSTPKISDDPLAFLMAPPSHGSAVARRTKSNQSMGPPSGNSVGPPSMGSIYAKAGVGTPKLPPSSIGHKQSLSKPPSTPQFVIFKPAPAKKDSDEKIDE